MTTATAGLPRVFNVDLPTLDYRGLPDPPKAYAHLAEARAQSPIGLSLACLLKRGAHQE